MKYKIGDEVLVKCKIIDVHPDSTVPYEVARTRCNSGFAKPLYIIAGDEDIEDMDAEEAWEIATRIFLDRTEAGFRDTELAEIFGDNSAYRIMYENTPQQAKDKIEAWEVEKKIKVGDVVDHDGEVGVVTNTADDAQGFYTVLLENGTLDAYTPARLKKTGRHIDIDAILLQIGGDE